MTTIKNNLKNYKKIFIVFGGGRWGLLHANELSEKNKDSIIYIYTVHNYNKLQHYKLNKNILIVNKIKKISDLDIHLIILANRYDKNYFLLKKYSNFKFNTIIEKPFLKGRDVFLDIYKKYQNNDARLSISTPWLYDESLINISKKINKKNISLIKFKWFSKKNLIKYNQIRKFDSSISHLTDTISHIISIIMCILNTNNLSIDNIKYTKLNKLEKTYFNILDKKIIIDNSNNHTQEKREILIYTNYDNYYKINFNSKFLKFSKNNKLLNTFLIKNNKIATQHQNILKKSKLQKKKDFEVFNSISLITQKILIEINK